mmetsp:Transcript_28805/g.65907  ORF Transcript_28805/g.65907 Transcript_28805/m.65907 type:complete len:239 (-) Transcript_28805:1428-2144(-)
MDLRSVDKLTERMSIPSISILPSFELVLLGEESSSSTRSNVSSRLDFPLPVRPTTPRVVPGLTSKFKFFRTCGEDSPYRTETLRNLIPPLQGQLVFWIATSTVGDRRRLPALRLIWGKDDPGADNSCGIFRGIFVAVFSIPELSKVVALWVDCKSVNSLALNTDIICVSDSVKHRTAQFKSPVMDSACVSPHPVDPAVIIVPEERRIMNMDAMADKNTMILPKNSNRTESHRSRFLRP